MNTYKIYKYTNLITGMSYIGQTGQSLRRRAGLNMIGYRHCEKFWEAIQHYGMDCWSVEILWDGLTLDEANIYEQIEIRDNETLYPYGYNLTYGGEGAGRPSDETRQKMSEARRDKKRPPFSEAHRKNISESLKKSKRFKELRRKVIVKIRCAAAYFVFVSRDINEIAKAFNTSGRTIRNWAEDPEWEAALDACGYTGDREIPESTKKKREDRAKLVVQIRCAAAYFVFVSRDINKIAEAFNTSGRTIRRWAEDPEWETALNACGYTGDRNFE